MIVSVAKWEIRWEIRFLTAIVGTGINESEIPGPFRVLVGVYSNSIIYQEFLVKTFEPLYKSRAKREESPDLNFPENLWEIIIGRIYAENQHKYTCQKSKDELWAAII